MDLYLSKIREFATSAANSVLGKIGREYSFSTDTPIGRSGLWALHSGRKRATNQPVTIWVIDKRSFEQDINRHFFNQQAQILDQLKRETSQLARLRHPHILQITEPLEETRQTLLFVTEPLIGVLEEPGDDFEIQCGLLQISKALQFLHGDAQMVHGNLVPSSIVVDAKGDWKLAGLAFVRKRGTDIDSYQYDYGMPEGTQRDLDYMAPEYIRRGQLVPACDMFSLGCLAYSLYNEGRSPLDCRNDTGAYERQVEQINCTNRLPEALVPAVRHLLVVDPQRRMTLEQFQKSGYFDNVLGRALRFLESLVEQPDGQKLAFMKGLPKLLPRFPESVLRRKILPSLLQHTNDKSLLPYILPSVFYIAEKITPEQFLQQILPKILAISPLDQQVHLVLLGSMAVLQQKCPEDVFKTQVMPMVLYNGLVSQQQMEVQDKCLEILPSLSGHLEYTELKTQVLPRVMQIYSKANLLSRKVSTLKCLHGMVQSLGEQLLVDQVMPLLRRTKTQEASVVMAMLELYETMAGKMGIRVVAMEVVPALWGLAMSKRLDVGQFRRIVKVIRQLEERVVSEQLGVLERTQGSNVSREDVVEDGWGEEFVMEGKEPDVVAAVKLPPPPVQSVELQPQPQTQPTTKPFGFGQIPLSPTKKPAPMQLHSKHAGGKSTNLKDFDPFA